MGFGFKIIVEGDYACFSRPEYKSDKVSYAVPTPGALEGLIKSIYWKPAIRYVIDKIVVFNEINYMNLKRNAVGKKVSLTNVNEKIKTPSLDICIYTGNNDTRMQYNAMILKNVCYGVEFHFELTGINNSRESETCLPEGKHADILKRRLERGQYFKYPCLGCSEFPVNRVVLVNEFDMQKIHPEIIKLGDVNIGPMEYRVAFEDKGIPKQGEWNKMNFSDKAHTEFYNPHMVNGVIDVDKWRRKDAY
ncbi:type I-C CRISPR-associated protein Cas5c [Aminicella lysinilytica]|jgi:CRISPR-associated protein Cas5d|uniref:type I-C CRISPR-associated protein Cas5c n=1 Tax=Aminicella lysinilytica TaxID=433323 RepID=UPI0026F1379F|nr:type I-C CRISPR-associated protein Cas5c [Aminicella lysinilytica]